MKHITLSKLILNNFKGIRESEIQFAHYTVIYGRNRAGKTTIVDAFMWLLFDKDSTGRKDFEIKTLGPDNQPYHRLDHEVIGVFDIAGQEVSLRKCLKEKWTKPRGQKDLVFEGHETTYFWNDVPMKKNEYQAKVSEIISESTFRMITNPLYFNTELKWQERRETLVNLAGNPSNEEVIESMDRTMPGFEALVAALHAGKRTDQFKSEMSQKKNKIKEELEKIPYRIDEANRSMPEELDYHELEASARLLADKITKIDISLADVSEAEKERAKQISELLNKKQEYINRCRFIITEEEQKVRQIAQERLKRLNESKMSLSQETHSLTLDESSLQRLTSQMNSFQKRKADLLAEYRTISDTDIVFDDKDFCCPTCKRAYEAENVEAKKNEMKANFLRDKSEKLEQNKATGTQVAAEIANLVQQIKETEERINAQKRKIDSISKSVATQEEFHTQMEATEAEQVKKAIAENSERAALLLQIAEIDEKVNAPVSNQEKNDAIATKSQIQQQLDDIKAKLATKEQRQKIQQRISDLEKQEREMSTELTGLEGIEFAIEKFTSAKMDIVEARVNGMFGVVKFKLFEEQINGGVAETCIALIDGVPFSDANTASKINAGLDVIRTLNRHYDVYAPIFIDNRESVTEIIEMESQVISLVVSPDDFILRIERKEMASKVA